jgi:hypothetical protein
MIAATLSGVCVAIYDGIYLFKGGRRIGAGGMPFTQTVL